MWLVQHGVAGWLEGFAADGQTWHRDERVILHSAHGLEIGTLRRHLTAHEEPEVPEVGYILRPATPLDETLATEQARLAEQLRTVAETLIAEQALPLLMLDAEIVLDGQTGILHWVAWQPCDPTSLLQQLHDTFHLQLLTHDESRPVAVAASQSCCSSGRCGSTKSSTSTQKSYGSCTGGCGGCSSKRSASRAAPPASGRIALPSS